MKPKRILTGSLLAVACAIAMTPMSALTPGASAQQQEETTYQLIWQSFLPGNHDPFVSNDIDRYRLSDRDVISVSFSPSSLFVDTSGYLYGNDLTLSSKDDIGIELTSGQNVTWWKGITAYKNAPERRPGSPKENWIQLAYVQTVDDNHGPIRMTLHQADLINGFKLVFQKAKFLGAHADIYELRISRDDLKHLKQSVIKFTWERDG